MGNWLKLKTIKSTSKFPFKAKQKTFQSQYMMYWSGTSHFSHITQNVLENSRVRELRLKPKVCDSTFTIILPLSHTLFSQNHLTSGDLKFLGKKYAFLWVFWSTSDKGQKCFLNQSRHVCESLNFSFVRSQLIFFCLLFFLLQKMLVYK